MYIHYVCGMSPLNMETQCVCVCVCVCTAVCTAAEGVFCASDGCIFLHTVHQGMN